MTTPLDISMRYVGQVFERSEPGKHHPFIQWCFSLCGMGLDTPDEVAWCSAFAQHAAWELRLPRSKSARARSWLEVGIGVDLAEAVPGFDVVVLNRSNGVADAKVISAPGHVGYFAGLDPKGQILVCAGNQGNAVSVLPFERKRLLGIRRIGAKP